MAVFRWAAVALLVGITAFFAEAAQDSSGAKPYSVVKVHKFTFAYKVEGVNLCARVTYPTKGWVAAGFNPTIMMKDANIIMGALVNGKTVSSDEFGVTNVSHMPDTAIGGKNNIVQAECTLDGKFTTFSFVIPLDSGDPKDSKLTAGDKVKLILAAGSSADFKEQHKDHVKTTIILK